MNLRVLRYLIAVADCLNFSRAAERCAVTQPTLSIQLGKLEAYLGLRIFERDRCHVRLTPEGEEIVRQARVIVAAADHLLAGRRPAARQSPDETCARTTGTRPPV